MDTKAVIRSQILSALAMLRQAVERCPEPLWNDCADRNRFWHVAYHALFYTHLYLSDTLDDFSPWALHRKEYNFLGAVPWPPHHTPVVDQPYTREEILAYCAFCAGQVEARVAALNLEAASGFDWLPFGKLELQFYNIRHLQQHTGELMERLGTRAGVDVDWVGSGAKIR